MFVSMLRLHAGLTRSDILRTGSPRILSDELTRSGDSGPRQHSAQQNPRWAGLHNRSNLIFALVISFAVIVAVLIRWSGLGSQSLWLDEGITFWISRFSPKHIWHILWLDTSNPLYYVLLHYWSVCFGTSEFSLRALSALFGTLSIPLFYGVARKIMADRTSLALATMLYAVSFFQVWYAQEARCYSLLVFLSLGTVYWLILCLANRATLRLCGLVLFLVAGLYTHNITIFYLPGIAVMWLVYPGEKTIRARVRDGLVVFSAVLLLYIPWLPHLRGHMQRIHTGWQLAPPKAKDALDSLCVLSGFDTRTLQAIFRDRVHTLRLFGFWTWAPAICLVFVLCALGGLCAVRSTERRKVAALLVYSLTPIFLVFIDSRISNPIYLNRIFLGSCALLPVVYCAPIAFQTGKSRKLFQVIGLVVLLGTTVSAYGYLRRERKEDWRGLTEYLLKVPERHRLLVVMPDIAQALVQYYVSKSPNSPGMTEMTGLLTDFSPPDLGLEERFLHLQDDPTTDALAILSSAMASGRYKEIDVAMMPGTSPSLVKPALEYLDERCASVDVVEFHWLEMRRCFVQGRTPN